VCTTLVPGGTIVALGPIVAPVIRSMTSKIVPLSERGTKTVHHLHVFQFTTFGCKLLGDVTPVNADTAVSGLGYSASYNFKFPF
jgi:hypothetical protein